MDNLEFRSSRHDFTRQVACPYCGKLTYATFPSACPEGYNYVSSDCTCSNCDRQYYARKYSDGSESVQRR